MVFLLATHFNGVPKTWSFCQFFQIEWNNFPSNIWKKRSGASVLSCDGWVIFYFGIFKENTLKRLKQHSYFLSFLLTF